MQCCHIGRVSVQLTLRKTTPRTCRLATDQCQSQRCGGAFEGRAPPTFTFMHLADACIQSDLQLHSDYIFSLVCVPWESNPQPFALLTQCSTTEPHRNPLAVIDAPPTTGYGVAQYIYIYIFFYIKCTNCNLHGIKWNERGKHIILVVHDMLLGLAIIGQCLLVAE